MNWFNTNKNPNNQGTPDYSTPLRIEGARGVEVSHPPTFAKGKTVVISRIYHPNVSGDVKSMGLLTSQINKFDGVYVGARLYLGGGIKTSSVTEVVCTLDASKIQVYRCKTETGSYYEVYAT